MDDRSQNTKAKMVKLDFFHKKERVDAQRDDTYRDSYI
jgi:hypothetical protein